MPTANTDSLLASALTKVKHRNSEMVKRDVITTLHHYRGLIPKADKFMFNDGAHRDMVNIYGTIPVPYKGQNYNIPVSVWILDSHPYHAPVCFVKPTADMQIKVSKHVDQSGQIYLPYLHEWSHPKSDLLGLIQILIVTFSEQPPVYSKPKGQEQPQQQLQASALPYPVYPQSVYQSTGAGYGGQFGNYSPSSSYPYPASGITNTTATTTNFSPHAFYGTNNGEAANQDQQQVLMRAEEAVRAKLRDEISFKEATTDEFRQVGEKLNEGRTKLNSIIEKLKQELEMVETELKLSNVKIDEMNSDKEKLDSSGDPVDCNEAVTATAPVFKQLLQAHAEDAAVEDALYFLGESLRRGVVDCESFLKHVRNLSRKQFLLRATMKKCRQTGGLPT